MHVCVVVCGGGGGGGGDGGGGVCGCVYCEYQCKFY